MVETPVRLPVFIIPELLLSIPPDTSNFSAILTIPLLTLRAIWFVVPSISTRLPPACV